MDLRIEKTQAAIEAAFLEIRSKKPLEKITVKELCEKARINKSTFYSHYQDIYDLSDQLETRIVTTIFSSIPNPERVLNNNPEFTRDLLTRYYAPEVFSVIEILFSDSRNGELVRKIQKELRKTLYELNPSYKDNPVLNIIMDYTVYGSYFALTENLQYGFDRTIQVISMLNANVTTVQLTPSDEKNMKSDHLYH